MRGNHRNRTPNPIRQAKDMLRNSIRNRENWNWNPTHGGYAQYWGGKDRNGKGRVVVVMVDILGNDLEYYAEQILSGDNAYIAVSSNALEIIQLVEDAMLVLKRADAQ